MNIKRFSLIYSIPLIVAFMIYQNITQIIERYKTTDWIEGEAAIEMASVAKKKFKKDDFKYVFDIKYKYKVGQTMYFGDEIGNKFTFKAYGSKLLAQQELNSLGKVGDSVIVHYNPNNPTESIIYRSDESYNLIKWAMYLLSLWFVVVSIIWLVRRRAGYLK